MMASGKGRVIVGTDASLTSLGALRTAVAEAQQRHTRLDVVYVRPSVPARDMPSLSLGLGAPVPLHDPLSIEIADNEARNVIASSIQQALGEAPAGLEIRRRVLTGRPGTVLATMGWRDDDLLVVGTTGGRRWHHPLRRSVSRYCATHAVCPVLVVPRSQLARAMRRRIPLRRSRFPRDPWKAFDATANRYRQHAQWR